MNNEIMDWINQLERELVRTKHTQKKDRGYCVWFWDYFVVW